MKKKLDIIVYGATGFTGKLCLKYLKNNYSDLNWGIAGRNKNKLNNLIKIYALDCEVFIADGNDLAALDIITKKTKVVLSTAGPFYRYGSKYNTPFWKYAKSLSFNPDEKFQRMLDNPKSTEQYGQWEGWNMDVFKKNC